MLIEKYPPSLDQMLLAWNEADPAKVRVHLQNALDPQVHFVDPTVNIRGIDAFEKMVHDVHARLPDATYSRVSAIDAHNDLHRYHWAIHMNGELAVQGFDVTQVSGSKIIQVIGFFGDLPLNRRL